MKKEIVKKALELAKCRISIDSAWCGRIYDQKEKDAFDDAAVELIKKATEAEFSEAYDDLIDYGFEESEITAGDVLRILAGKAPCAYDNVVVNSVNCF